MAIAVNGLALVRMPHTPAAASGRAVNSYSEGKDSEDMNDKKLDEENSPQAQPNGSGNAAAPQRYSFSITDTERKHGPLTISIEVENDAIMRMTAVDSENSQYDINFHLRRHRPEDDVRSAAPQPGAGNKPHNGDDDDDDDDDDNDGGECEVCQVVNGRLRCWYVPC
jgi:hypothetical protein